MENKTQNAAVSEQSVDSRQYQPFNPKATLLLNILPEDTGKTAVEPMKKQMTNKPGESTETLLQGLLLNTEASAEKTLFAKRRWQLISLLAGMLLIASMSLNVWMNFETHATKTLQGRLEIDNQSLREQLTLAGSEITGLKSEMEAMLNRNVELVTENARLKPQTVISAAAVSSKSSPADSGRIGAARNGTYSKGTTKEELISALGEPDRIYNTRGYEQLVYFGKKPGRFWLLGGRVVQVGG